MTWNFLRRFKASIVRRPRPFRQESVEPRVRHMRQRSLSSKTDLCPAPAEEPTKGAGNVSCRGLVTNAMTDSLNDYIERMQALRLQ
jgi:hypothetical protein